MTTPVESRPVVLLVDDDPAVRDSLTFALGFEGFDLRTYESAEDLLEAGAPPEAVCLIADLQLPGVNGLTLVARLRSAGATIPAILITTNPSTLVRARALAHGAAIVEKPLLTDGLLDALRRVAPAA